MNARVLLASAVMSLGVVCVSHAGTPQGSDVPRLAVSYSDLDLSSEKDVAKLYSRITKAAQEVCPQPSKYSMRVTDLSRRCVTAAIARAVHDVNSPQLAKLEAVRNKRTSQG